MAWTQAHTHIHTTTRTCGGCSRNLSIERQTCMVDGVRWPFAGKSIESSKCSWPWVRCLASAAKKDAYLTPIQSSQKMNDCEIRWQWFIFIFLRRPSERVRCKKKSFCQVTNIYRFIQCHLQFAGPTFSRNRNTFRVHTALSWDKNSCQAVQCSSMYAWMQHSIPFHPICSAGFISSIHSQPC